MAFVQELASRIFQESGSGFAIFRRSESQRKESSKSDKKDDTGISPARVASAILVCTRSWTAERHGKLGYIDRAALWSLISQQRSAEKNEDREHRNELAQT